MAGNVCTLEGVMILLTGVLMLYGATLAAAPFVLLVLLRGTDSQGSKLFLIVLELTEM